MAKISTDYKTLTVSPGEFDWMQRRIAEYPNQLDIEVICLSWLISQLDFEPIKRSPMGRQIQIVVDWSAKSTVAISGDRERDYPTHHPIEGTARCPLAAHCATKS